jgi:hypothetical protein
MIMKHKLPLIAALALTLPLASQAQQKIKTKVKTVSTSTANAEDAIREADIKRDVFALAGDHYRGREAGTLDELKASVWLADQIRALGALPAGDDGTYFQWFTMQRTRLTKGSTLTIGSHALKVNHDAILFADGVGGQR